MQRTEMLEAPIPNLICKLAIPTVTSQLITVLYNTADTYFVSQISTGAAAAVGVVFAVMSMIQALGFGLGMGAGSIISRKLGEQKAEEANRYGNSALFAALILGILIQMIGILKLESIMKMLGSTETILPYSCVYGRVIFYSAPIMCVSFVLNNILRAEGDVLFSMIGLGIGGILNVFLDPLFIMGFHMGIMGAAVATMVSQCVSLLVLLSVFIRKKTCVQFGGRWISKDYRDYVKIIKIGFPTICRQGLASVSSALLNICSAGYGDAAVAAVTIANKVYLLVRNIIVGIGQGYQPAAGYNFGAGKESRVKKLFWFTCKIGTILCIFFAVLLGIFSKEVVQWFNHDPQVVIIGQKALLYACMVMPFMAYSTYVNQTLQCLGFSKSATFLAACRQGICFWPLIFVLPKVLGLDGIQMVQPLADFSTFAISVPFQFYFWKKKLNR